MTAYRQRLDAGVYKQGAAPAAAPLPHLEPDEATTGAFVCPDCGRTFDSEHGLKIHRTKAHGATNDGDT